MSDMKLEQQKRIKIKLDCGYVYDSVFFFEYTMTDSISVSLSHGKETRVRE